MPAFHLFSVHWKFLVYVTYACLRFLWLVKTNLHCLHIFHLAAHLVSGPSFQEATEPGAVVWVYSVVPGCVLYIFLPEYFPLTAFCTSCLLILYWCKNWFIMWHRLVTSEAPFLARGGRNYLWYSLHLPTEGWPGWVAWINTGIYLL